MFCLPLRFSTGSFPLCRCCILGGFGQLLGSPGLLLSNQLLRLFQRCCYLLLGLLLHLLHLGPELGCLLLGYG